MRKVILGDMNIEYPTELQSDTPTDFHSLNSNCEPTNTNLRSQKPYDHVMIMQANTGNEIDNLYGFKILGLRTEMKPFGTGSMFDYPGKPLPDYNHDKFRVFASDHNPVTFRMHSLPTGDDD
jgi:hypothetical protein